MIELIQKGDEKGKKTKEENAVEIDRREMVVG